MTEAHSKLLLALALRNIRTLCAASADPDNFDQGQRRNQLWQHYTLGQVASSAIANAAVTASLLTFEPLVRCADMDGELRRDFELGLDLFIAQVDSMGLDELYGPKGK